MTGLFDFDAAVVGAGAVGLACAYALARRGLDVVVLETADHIGAGVSSRNSEVIHAGLYYPTGSLKARLCVEGRRALYAFLEAHQVAYRKCGKLVVATEAAEVPRLEAVALQAETNGVEGLRWLDGAQARAVEPALHVAAALASPESGIFDSHGYMRALLGEVEDRGGAVALNTPFAGASPLVGGGFTVRTGGDQPARFAVRLLVTAPGLGAQTVAAGIEGYPADLIPERRLGKGNYFRLIGPAPFQRLIYPPPVPGSSGSHYRLDMGGQAVFGPDLEYVETEDYRVDPARAPAFYAAIRRFWPALPDGALQPDYAGLRPKLHGPGEPQPDFVLQAAEAHGMEGLVTLFGIESPGLTSSLALGEEVAFGLVGAGGKS